MLNLLLFLPVLLLLLAALGIVILQQTRPGIGYAWSIAAVSTLVTAGAVLVLRWRVPMQVAIEWWRPFAEYSTPPVLRLDQYSWPYAFCLALIALGFILTDSARLETEAIPYNWAIGLALTALGIFTVMSGNLHTLIVAWTAVDMVELIMLMTNSASRRMGAQTVTLFAVRVTGTLLAIVTVLLARSQDVALDLNAIPPNLSLLLLLAAGLRLGVLPLNVAYTREVYALRGLGNVMRMIGPATSMMLLGRMPAQAVPPEWVGILIFLSALAAVYGAAMWLASRNEIHGRPFWFTALAALGIASVINGQPQSSIAWGMALLLPGSLIFYYTQQRRQILFLPVLGLIGIIGLPFTPAAAGWRGIFQASSGALAPLFWLAGLMLALGYLRHVFLRPRGELYRLERWVHTVYPAGLLFLVAGQWIVSLIGWPGSFTLGIWWVSVALALFVALSIGLFLWLRASWTDRSPAAVDPLTAPVPGVTPIAEESVVSATQNVAGENPRAAARRWVEQFSRRVGGALAAFFRLTWLYSIFVWLYRLAQNFVDLLTQMFEGDGGILWSMVMLALLISLIWVGATP